LTDYTTGAISGWIVNDAGGLKHCDANFTNCGASVVSIVNNANVLLDFDAVNQRYFMRIDDQLFVYNAKTGTLSSPLFTIPSGTFVGPPVVDGAMVYFGHEKSIYQIPVDGSSMAVELVVEANDISRIDLTTNKVIYQVGKEVKQINKTGGVASLLVAASGSDNIFFFVSGNYIYYSVSNMLFSVSGAASINNLIKAGMVNESGGGQSEFMNANWVGMTFSTSFDLNDPLSLFDDPVEMILAEGSGNGFSGATLRAFDAATGAVGVTLGTLPTLDMLFFFCGGNKSNVLCSALVNITPAPVFPALPFQSDVFFISSTTVGSLARVTNTGDKNEAPLVF